MEHQTDSKFIKHIPCDNCGSSDGNSLYSDGHTYCFVCNTHTPGDNPAPVPKPQEPPKPQNLPNGIIDELTDRHISRETCQRYGVKHNRVDTQISRHLYPYTDKNGNHIGTKVRDTQTKDFKYIGDSRNSILFGQHIFAKGGKYLTIFEGEVDALSGYEMLGSRWPCVSIKNGAQSAVSDCQKNFEYINSFDTIVLCFDNDEPGRKASQQVADLFPPNKVKVVDLHLKDANEYIATNNRKGFTQLWWEARDYTPEGIILGESTWDLIENEKPQESLPYPWRGMNDMTYGMRKSELTCWCAGSGIGKSSVMRELAHHIVKNTTESVGCLFLEESVLRTAKGLMSVEANLPLHLPTTTASMDIKKDAWNQTLGTGRVRLWDHFGATNIDNVISKIQYLSSGLACKYIIVDHLHMIVGAHEGNDERRAIDTIMTRLRTLVQEQGIHLMLVSHLRRTLPQNNTAEEGGSISLADLRGSHGIAQLCDMVFALIRNGQADTEDKRNLTTIRVLKNRFSGETGPCCWLKWDKNTGRMQEQKQPEPTGESDTDAVFL